MDNQPADQRPADAVSLLRRTLRALEVEPSASPDLHVTGRPAGAPAPRNSPLQDVLDEAHEQVSASCGRDVAMAIATLDGFVCHAGGSAPVAATATWPFLYALALHLRPGPALPGLSAFAGRLLDAAPCGEAGNSFPDVVAVLSALGALDEPAGAALTDLLAQPSPLLTASDLAVSAATLANGGRNPVTSRGVVSAGSAGRAIAAMAAGGLSRTSATWLSAAGHPAVAGPGGLLACVVPAQAGIGLACAGQDALEVLEEAGRTLTSALALSPWQCAGREGGRQGRSYAWDGVRSRSRRTPAERQVLTTPGSRIVVHELSGEQSFATAEAFARRVLDRLDGVGWLVLDARRCGRMADAGETLLRRLFAAVAEQDVPIAVVDPLRRPDLASLADAAPGGVRLHAALDSALEDCEVLALTRRGHVVSLPDGLVPLGDQEILRELNSGQLAVVRSGLTTKVFTPGTIVYRDGDPADGLYLVGAGLLESDVPIAGGRRRCRSGVIGAGQAFGETALLGQERRAERVAIVDPALCHVLPQPAFEQLQAQHPAIAVALLVAVARSLSERLDRATALLGALQT